MFVKYPSIDNSYREKAIHRWVKMFPALAEETYFIQEKIHGSNIQLAFSDDEMEISSRNQVVDRNWMGVGEVLDKMQDFIGWAKGLPGKNGRTMRFYGEYYGGSLSKGVNYPGKQIRFFDLKFGEVWVPPASFWKYGIFGMTWPQYVVPTIAVVNGLEKALDFSAEFQSNLCDSPAEGIVIKPSRPYVDANGSLFYLKKKAERFREISEEPTERVIDEEVESWNAVFKTYLTENRLQNVFSHLGPIHEKAQLGDYIRAFITDAKDDFLKDHEVPGEKVKQICNVGALAAKMVMKCLPKEQS